MVVISTHSRSADIGQNRPDSDNRPLKSLAVIDAYNGEALNAFVNSVGVKKLLQMLRDAAPNLHFEILDKDDDFALPSD